MSNHRSAVIYGGLAGAGLSCLAFLLVCPHRADCLRSLTHLDAWLNYGSRVALPMLVISALAWLIRLGWILAAACGWRRQLLEVAVPPAVQAAIERTGVRRVVAIRGARPESFCAGAFRPRVFVTDSLAQVLDPIEIEAVLLHEDDHARRLEPLLRAALHAAAEVFFYVPLLRWFALRRIEESELRADRVALERLGPRPVAGALWALGSRVVAQGVAAFGGAAELRVAQVLGDPVPRRSLAGSTVAISAMGAYLALQVASCLLQITAHL
ncbi:MAG: M56 family metallopeptidase [Candidatus Dormibacteraeota bacterium]|nr:M56 family metallopeptidase [Candidatus Dormibacteraeota bacterium]